MSGINQEKVTDCRLLVVLWHLEVFYLVVGQVQCLLINDLFLLLLLVSGVAADLVEGVQPGDVVGLGLQMHENF